MNNQDHRQSTASHLRSLIQVSEALRDAMRARDPERIQAVVSQQDDVVRRFAFAHTETDDPTEDSSEDQLDMLVTRLRRLQVANRLMAGAFSRLYRGALQQLSGAVGQDPGIYGNAGRIASAPVSPMLVRQTG